MNTEDAVLARIVRGEAGLIVAQLQRRLGNFDIAEEAVQEAIVVALRTWRRDGRGARASYAGRAAADVVRLLPSGAQR